MRFLALLLDITKDDVFNAYAKTRYVTPAYAWSALTYSSYYCHCSGEGLAHLTVGIVFTGTNAELLRILLKYVIPDGEANQCNTYTLIALLYITKKPSQQDLHNKQAPEQRHAPSKIDLRATSE